MAHLFEAKRITIAGKTYRVRKTSYGAIRVSGPGLVDMVLMDENLESTDLRERLIAAIADYRERRRKASEMIQERVKNGTAGLSNPKAPSHQN